MLRCSVCGSERWMEPLFYVSRRQAYELLSKGDAIVVSHQKQPLKLQLAYPEERMRHSPSAISHIESMRNAGVAGTPGQQRAARIKVKLWRSPQQIQNLYVQG